jgi:hypothetical protein
LISGSVVALKDRTAPDGVERRRSTKCIHEAAAREILHGLEAAELLGARAGAVAQQFRALIREAVARVTGRALPDPTIRAHLAAWVAGEEGAVAPATLERYRQVASDFEAFLGPGPPAGWKRSARSISSPTGPTCKRPATARRTSTKFSRSLPVLAVSPPMNAWCNRTR